MRIQAKRPGGEKGVARIIGCLGTGESRSTAKNRRAFTVEKCGAAAAPTAATIFGLLALIADYAAVTEVQRTAATEGEQVLVPEAGGAARDGGGGLALPHHPRGEHESEQQRRLAEEVSRAARAVVVGQEEEEEEHARSAAGHRAAAAAGAAD